MITWNDFPEGHGIQPSYFCDEEGTAAKAGGFTYQKPDVFVQIIKNHMQNTLN